METKPLGEAMMRGLQLSLGSLLLVAAQAHGQAKVLKAPDPTDSGRPKVNRPTFSTDGKYLVADVWQATALWDVDAGKVKAVFPCQGTAAERNPFSFSPASKSLAMAGWFPERNKYGILVVDVLTGRELDFFDPPFNRLVSHVHFLTEKKLIYLQYETLYAHRLNDPEKKRDKLKIRRAEPDHVAFSPDRKMMALSGRISRNDPVVSLWDLEALERIAAIEADDQYQYGRDIHFTPDGKALLARLVRKNTACWAELFRVPELTRIRDFSSDIADASFFPDSKRVVSFAYARGDVWNLETARREPSLLLPPTVGGQVEFAVFSPCGKYLARPSRKGDAINLHEVATLTFGTIPR